MAGDIPIVAVVDDCRLAVGEVEVEKFTIFRSGCAGL